MDTNIPLFPGQFYHIYNRGINKSEVFFESCNYLYFVRLFEKYISPAADMFAYCLIANHYHMLLRMKEDSHIDDIAVRGDREVQRWSQPFSNMFNSYTKAINTRYGRTGSLFQRTFHRRRITEPSQLTYLVRYIHLNPQTHGVTADFADWPYSSYRTLRHNMQTWLDRDAVISWFGGIDEFERFHVSPLRGRVELRERDFEII